MTFNREFEPGDEVESRAQKRAVVGSVESRGSTVTYRDRKGRVIGITTEDFDSMEGWRLVPQRKVRPIRSTGSWLKEMREAFGYSQRDVEALSEGVVSAAHLSAIESDRVERISAVMLLKLGQVYGADHATLLRAVGLDPAGDIPEERAIPAHATHGLSEEEVAQVVEYIGMLKLRRKALGQAVSQINWESPVQKRGRR